MSTLNQETDTDHPIAMLFSVEGLVFLPFMEYSDRVICRYDEGRQGPLLVCLGAVHGNEPAGVEAIEIVGTLLENEPAINPDFTFSGRIIGLVGNLQALRKRKRFLKTDMNRSFDPGAVGQILDTDESLLEFEELEVYQLVQTIFQEIEEYQPTRVVILDIHSTSATGGIFVITTDEVNSIDIGKELHAPVILDFAKEVSGTTLGYFNKKNFNSDIVTVVFECGQHEERLSVNRAIAAIINCMRTVGCVRADSVENKHDKLLLEYSAGLPKVSRLIERYAIPGDVDFRMAKPYPNFTEVQAGEVVAYQQNKPVKARHDGLILLPRLQEQGDDGFFIIEPVLEEEGVTTS